MKPTVIVIACALAVLGAVAMLHPPGGAARPLAFAAATPEPALARVPRVASIPPSAGDDAPAASAPDGTPGSRRGAGRSPADALGASGPGGSNGLALPTPGPTVYVVGAVRTAGVYALAPGARIVGAVHAAGGLAADADPAAIDLAAFVRDGQQITVPRIGETGVVPQDQTRDDTGGGTTRTRGRTRSRSTGALVPSRSRSRATTRGDSSTGGDPADRSEAPIAPLDVNSASAEDLMTIRGIGPALADRIVRFREANGPFESTDGLLDVNGITDALYGRIASSLTVARTAR